MNVIVLLDSELDAVVKHVTNNDIETGHSLKEAGWNIPPICKSVNLPVVELAKSHRAAEYIDCISAEG